MALTLGQHLNNDLELSLNNEFDTCCFTVMEHWLEQNMEVLVLLRTMPNPRGVAYRSIPDLILGTFIPGFATLIQRYYDDRGPTLQQCCDEPTVGKIEIHLLQMLHQLRLIYYRIEQQGWKEGMPTSASVRRALRDLTITTIQAPPIPRLPRR